MKNPHKDYFKKYFFYRYLYIKKKIHHTLIQCFTISDSVALLKDSKSWDFVKVRLKHNCLLVTKRKSLRVSYITLNLKKFSFLLLQKETPAFIYQKGVFKRIPSVNSVLSCYKYTYSNYNLKYNLRSSLKLTKYFNYLSSKFNKDEGVLKFKGLFLTKNLDRLTIKSCLAIDRFTYALQYDPFNSHWFLDGRDKVLGFLAKHLKTLKIKYGFSVILERFCNFTYLKFNLSSLILGKQKNNLFITIQTFTDDKLLCGKFYNLITRNTYFFKHKRILYLIDKNLINFLVKLEFLFLNKKVLFIANFKSIVHPCKVISTYYMLRYFLGDITLPKSWIRLINFVLKKKGCVVSSLKKYQTRGVRWLLKSHSICSGGVLGDEMGLGKTLQSLYVLNKIYLKGTPNVVVCPKGLVDNWIYENCKFKFKGTNLIPLTKNKDLYKKNLFNLFKRYSWKVTLLTSFNFLENNLIYFYNVQYNSIFIDEAHVLKNVKSLIFISIRVLKSYSKFLLTGTPFKNKVSDIFSLNICFLHTNLQIPKIISESGLHITKWLRYFFKKILLFFFMRRLKKKELKLPNKLNFTALIQMGSVQKYVYSRLMLYANSIKKLSKLRRICADFKIKKSETSFTKSKLLTHLIKACIFTNKKVIVYSQYVKILTTVKENLTLLKFRFMYIDGSTLNRLEVCNKFNSSGTINVLVVSVKSAGLGFNITSANVIIHLDPWWNVSLEYQGTDRAHRIGQKNKLINIKFLVNNSIETKILNLQGCKRILFFSFFKC